MDNQQYNEFTNFMNTLKNNITFEKKDITNNEKDKITTKITLKHTEKTDKENAINIQKKLKCTLCKVKINAVDVIISSCKCEKKYCLKHRMPESHKCEKLENIKEIQKNNLGKNLIKIDSCKLERL